MSFDYKPENKVTFPYSVFHANHVIYKPDGTGRDVHCFTAQRSYYDSGLPKLKSGMREYGGRLKQIQV